MSSCDSARNAQPWLPSVLLTAALGMGLFSTVPASLQAASINPQDSVTVAGVWVGEHGDARGASDLVRLLKQNGESAQLGKARVPWTCSDRNCLLRAATELHAKRLLLATVQEIDQDRQNYLITVRLFDASSQKVEERQISCDGCTPQLRAEQTANAVSEMISVQTAPSSAEPAPTLEPAPNSSAGQEVVLKVPGDAPSTTLKPLPDETPPARQPPLPDQSVGTATPVASAPPPPAKPDETAQAQRTRPKGIPLFADPNRPPESSDGAPRPLYRRWWPWTIAGLAAGAIVGGIVGAKANANNADPTMPLPNAVITYSSQGNKP